MRAWGVSVFAPPPPIKLSICHRFTDCGLEPGKMVDCYSVENTLSILIELTIRKTSKLALIFHLIFYRRKKRNWLPREGRFPGAGCLRENLISEAHKSDGGSVCSPLRADQPATPASSPKWRRTPRIGSATHQPANRSSNGKAPFHCSLLFTTPWISECLLLFCGTII